MRKVTAMAVCAMEQHPTLKREKNYKMPILKIR